MISTKKFLAIVILSIMALPSCDRVSLYDFARKPPVDPDAKRFTSFRVLNFSGIINNDALTITVTLPGGTDLSSLVPVFAILGDRAEMGGAAITSGLSVIDCTSPAIITVFALNGTSQDYTVTVTAMGPTLNYITVAPDAPNFGVGETLQLAAIAHFSDSSTVNVTASALWISDNELVATVSGGLVTGNAQGTSLITAEYLGETAAVTVTVSLAPPVLDHIEVLPFDANMETGEFLQFTATAYYTDSSTADVTYSATWISSAPECASVVEGMVSALAEGTAMITAQYGGISSESASVTVTAAPPELDYVAVEPGNDYCEANSTIQLTATAHYIDSSAADITSSATWITSNAMVATVSAGLVTCLSPGSVAITAQYLTESNFSTITVTAQMNFYVATWGNDDNGGGSTTNPYLTIQKAIDTAPSGGTVHVAQGNYAENVYLADGVSVMGSYSTDFTSRNVSAHASTICPSTGFAVNCSTTMGNSTVFDGFNIIGSGGGMYAGISLSNGAAPTIQNNIINGGTNAAGQTFGIYIAGSAPIIQNNIINGGSSSSGNSSTGIFCYSTGSAPVIRNNCINGGTGDSTQGIYCNGTTGLTLTIRSNTINGGSGTTIIYGIYISNETSAVIQNNIIFRTGSAATMYGIYEATETADPVSVENNDIISSTENSAYGFDYVYYDYGAGTPNIQNESALNTSEGGTTRANNTLADPLLADIPGGDWHLTGSSPISVTQGGMVIGSYDDDCDGILRTFPWSIGAFEFD